MKTKILILFLLAAVSFTYGQEVITGKSKVKKLIIPQEKTVKELPNLEIRNKVFTDQNSNNIIDGNEKSMIKFQVYNSGKGLAENVQVKVSLKDPDTKGITFDKIITVGDLATKQSKDITIPVEADKSVQTGTATFIIEVAEKNGFNAFPFAMAIGTQEFTLAVTVVEGVIEEQPQEVITAEPEVHMRGVGDPLKGLNVSGDRNEMQIGKYYALIIGIDDYWGAFEPLDNAVKDAESIERLLKSKYKFDNFITLYNRHASKKGILNAFEELSNTVKETDNVFIFYSGHGEFNERQNKGYWVPCDARSNSMYELISNNDIQTALTGI
ncbi:MAG: caspase family protein, partial [Bacteroidales bacterium]|nr:caspase family protein [Bacteroidales bacterium]